MNKSLLICFLVGCAVAVSATQSGAWKQNTEYVYRVHGRTLAALHDVADQYTGMLIRANLKIQTKSDSRLIAQIVNPEQANVHVSLPEGWSSFIPQEQLHYKKLSLSNKPFEILLENGAVKELLVNRDISEWEANLIKSFVSQIQVDVRAENLQPSRVNQKLETNEYSANYKVMEPTVTGECVTMYNIMPAAEHVLERNPEWVPVPHLKGDGKILRIVKNKDYTQCREMAEEHFALDIVNEKIYGKSSEYLIKSGNSEIFVTGNKEHHTIQSSNTVHKIIVSPTMANSQKGMVVSSMNLTLVSVDSKEQEMTVESPISIGNLVYCEGTPSEMSRRSSKTEETQRRPLVRTRRSINDLRRDSEESEESQEQPRKFANRPVPKLDASPEAPLLKSFARQLKTELNPIRAALRFVKEVAVAIQEPAKLANADSLSQFSDLINVIRMMDAKEVAEFAHQCWERYQQDRDNAMAVLEWKVARDAIAQSGTGPALLTIKNWLKNKMIETEEAAQILAVLPRAVQHPTEEYIRAFYELATSQYVKPQIMANETAILSLTELVRLAYVDQDYAEKRFSMIYWEDSELQAKKIDFVKKELVPFLAEKLQEAIEFDDSEKAQLYIRALGNVADKSVFGVFKPYLEGERKISQFQRLLMIVSMDQLAAIHPKTTRTILYRIIVNNGESSQVRVASIYQLMRCHPSKNTLQTLASLTFTEPSRHVRAAIKSSIEAATELKGIEHAYLAENAKSAVKLLNPETYGIQYAYNYLKSYIVKEMPLKYTQTMHSIFGEDSVWPSHLHYSLRLIEGDVSRQYMSVSAMLSSIKSLTAVVAEQFPEETQKRQAEHAWADKIATLLKIQMDQPEKFEANLFFEIFGGKRFLTINNQTLEQLPQLFKNIVRELEAGQRFNYTKLYVDDEVHITFPTEMSLPFVYTLRRPSLINVGGQVQIPGKLNINNAKVNGEIKITSAHITEAKLGFVNPLDKKFYAAGYTKNMMLNLPISVKLAMDLEKQQLNVEFAPIQPEQDENILHVSTWPYTYQDSLLADTTGPISKRVHLIHKHQDDKFETVFGKDNGIAFRAKMSNEKHEIVDYHTMQESIKTYGPWAPLISLIRERTIRHSMLNINYIARESTSRSVNFAISYKTQRGQRAENENESEINMESLMAIPANEKETREREYLKKVQSGLVFPSAAVIDMSVQFSGKKQPKYAATFALATNSLEDKYQQLCYLYRAESQDDKPFHMFAAASTKKTSAPQLNFIDALRAESNLKSDVHIRFGQEQQNLSELKLKVKFEKSEERRQALQRSEMAHLCKLQMENKKWQHPACANLTVQASMMDRMFIEAQHKNIDTQTKDLYNRVMNLVRYLGYDYLDEKIAQNVNENTIRITAQMEPELFEAVNVTIETPKTESRFKNIRVNEWVRPLLTANTEINPIDLFMAKATRRVQANSVCVIENNSANTFNNKSYPLALGNCYHALLHINLEPNVYQEQNYGYTVLVRDSVKYANTKDLKIVYYYRDISQILDLVSVGENQYEVYVNDKKIELPVDHAFIVNDDVNKPWAKIVYQHKELRVDFDLTQAEQLDDVTIYYNGARVKVAIDDKFQGQVRGLCGTVSGESFFDFVTPRNTINPDARLFAASYALADETCQGPAKNKQRLAVNSPTIRRETVFTRVVSENDISENTESRDRCNARHQTRYTIENEGQTICFTTRPLPVCGSGCRPSKTIEKNVNVHCLQRSNAVNLYKSQIDKGASPDFSGKQVTKTIKIRVPQSCN